MNFEIYSYFVSVILTPAGCFQWRAKSAFGASMPPGRRVDKVNRRARTLFILEIDLVIEHKWASVIMAVIEVMSKVLC